MFSNKFPHLVIINSHIATCAEMIHSYYLHTAATIHTYAYIATQIYNFSVVVLATYYWLMLLLLCKEIT